MPDEQSTIARYTIGSSVGSRSKRSIRTGRGGRSISSPARAISCSRRPPILIAETIGGDEEARLIELAVRERVMLGDRAALLVVPIYVAFAIVAPWLGWLVARVFRLEVAAGRAVAFSAGRPNQDGLVPKSRSGSKRSVKSTVFMRFSVFLSNTSPTWSSRAFACENIASQIATGFDIETSYRVFLDSINADWAGSVSIRASVSPLSPPRKFVIAS